MKMPFAIFLAIVSVLTTVPANATFSIIACERETGVCGAAVATHNLAVGASVPTLVSGVGVVVSQFETNPNHGRFILAELKKGLLPQQALATVLSQTEPFEGLGAEWRQIGIVAPAGEAAAHTGKMAGEQAYAGHIVSVGVTVQGNGLASDTVLLSALEAFENTDGGLASRLLRALEVAKQAGGQSIGLKSAALIVRTPDGWPVDIDLRVDSSKEPIQDLRSAYNEHVARIVINQAERSAKAGKMEVAYQLLQRANDLAPQWDRVARRSALLAFKAGNMDLARVHASRFQALNPVWSGAWCSDPGLTALIECD